jgi:hypothetical protein
MFSTLIVETKNNKPLSKYMSNSLKILNFMMILNLFLIMEVYEHIVMKN